LSDWNRMCRMAMHKRAAMIYIVKRYKSTAERGHAFWHTEDDEMLDRNGFGESLRGAELAHDVSGAVRSAIEVNQALR
jgi:hypothetical protein